MMMTLFGHKSSEIYITSYFVFDSNVVLLKHVIFVMTPRSFSIFIKDCFPAFSLSRTAWQKISSRHPSNWRRLSGGYAERCFCDRK
jgi:hypothetical protein